MTLDSTPAMGSSDHEDIANIASEAKQILDDLHESHSSESNRSKSPPDAGVLRTEAGNVVDAEIKADSGKSQLSRREMQLFTKAISILRSQGKLIAIAKDATPSAQHSRRTESSFVICDTNGRVLGRVPLKMINGNALSSEKRTTQYRLETDPCNDKDFNLTQDVYSKPSGSHSVPIHFVHPTTGKTVRPNWTMVVLGSLIFGPIFFLVVGEVGHGILYIIAAIVFGMVGLGLIVGIAYTIAARQIIRAKWRSKGYTEINGSRYRHASNVK
jgi:hypothetical protein